MPRSRLLIFGMAAMLGVLAGLWLVVNPRSDLHPSEEQESETLASAMKPADLTLAAVEHTHEDIAADVTDPSPLRSQRARSRNPTMRAERWSAGIITGRVLGGPGASEPIAGIVVRAGSPRSTFPVPPRTTRTDAKGHYEFRELVAAHWEVDAWLTELDRRAAADVVLDEEEMPEAELDILLPYDRHVEVRLVDVRGEPIGPASLGIDAEFLALVCVGVARSCKHPGEVLRPVDMPLNRVVDVSPERERNTFDVVIQGVGGECVLALFGDRVIVSHALAPGVTRLDLVLDPESVDRVRGSCTVEVVRACDGAACGSGRVQVLMPGVTSHRDIGADGRASIAGVPFGKVTVTVKAHGFARKYLDVQVSGSERVRVELLAERKITGRIVMEGEREPSRLTPGLWRVLDPKARLGAPTPETLRRPDASAFGFEFLEPGVYVVAAVPNSVMFLTAEDVRAGKGAGAVWVDLNHVESADIRLEVPAWLGNP